MGSLDGQVAVITAGSTGIGFGIAQAFVAEGASVVLGNRSEEKGAYALERLNAGDRAVFNAPDGAIAFPSVQCLSIEQRHFGSSGMRKSKDVENQQRSTQHRVKT